MYMSCVALAITSPNHRHWPLLSCTRRVITDVKNPNALTITMQSGIDCSKPIHIIDSGHMFTHYRTAKSSMAILDHSTNTNWIIIMDIYQVVMPKTCRRQCKNSRFRRNSVNLRWKCSPHIIISCMCTGIHIRFMKVPLFFFLPSCAIGNQCGCAIQTLQYTHTNATARHSHSSYFFALL